MPSLRIDQSDLKCKNGCDYFGNPQWQGYCSKCYREQLQRQRRAEKASSGTLPKPEPKKTDRGLKLSSHSSFSKFEEKRLRQSETLKKAHLLKFSVFKKSSSDEQDHAPERKPPEFKVPGVVNEGMKREFRVRFPNLPQQVDRDARVFVHAFITDTIRCSDVMSVDELSERVQRQYQRFMKYMDTSSLFTNVDAETKEQLIDFVEKHAMMYLHEQPGVLFSPSGTEDERADRAMSERIQQLGWVSEDHLECRADRASAASRRLLYKAISELLGMDSSPHPGGKLWRVQRACRHVLALCGALASADDLLPALIFTVLKANPPRLVSNINFVTRFCNAQRLMTGEGGYYFTNLCCAVSFIENLSAESLSMDKKEFDSYMAMPASIGGSTWAAALSLCGATREAEEQRGEVDRLLVEVGELRAQADQLATDADTFEKRAIRAIYNMGPRESLRNKFKEINILTLSGQYIYENLRKEIVKKVQDVFTKTPLEIKPRRDLPRLGKLDNSTSLIDLETPTSQPPPPPQTIPEIKFSESKQTEPIKIQTDKHHLDQKHVKLQTPEKLTPPKSPQNQAWERKHSSSLELLTPSPVGFMSFDSRSIDELMTPDEFGSDHLAPGLSNINYDIDLSDLSGDNSLAEDTPREKDPFSPDGIKKPIFDPFAQSGQVSTVLDKFDELILVDQKSSQVSEAFEVVHRVRDPFDPIGPNEQSSSFSAIQKEQSSLLDDSGSPTAVCLLPSPLQPQSSKQN